MKKIFPIITILITLSLLGLIFFQFLWLKSAKEIKEQQLKENIIKASGDAAIRMADENKMMVPKKRNLIFQPIS